MAPHETASGEKIVIPAWVIKVLEWSIPAMLAAVWVYYQVQDLEKKNRDMAERVEQMEKRINQRDVSMAQYETQFAVITERHNALEKTLNIELATISQAVMEIKEDLKTLHVEIRKNSTLSYSPGPSKEASPK